MGSLVGLFYPWGAILQVVAIVHFIRRRPDGYWLWVILFLGPLGALAYIAMEVVPDLGLLRQSVDGLSRRKRAGILEKLILDNPSSGNLEELGDLYLDEGRYQAARESYDKALSMRAHSFDAYYRRGIAAMQLGDFQAARADFEYVVSEDPKYDFHRAVGLLAHAYANTAEPERADELFRQATSASTLSETYCNYATFLASQGRTAEAREWAQKILAKKPTMPGYLRRRERHWFRRASGLLKRLPA